MSTSAVALTIQFASCCYLTGLIVMVQRLAYPAFPRVERTRFVAYHRTHTNEMAVLAGPAMIADLSSALWLARTGEDLWLINALAAVLTWLLTFLVSVPLHNQLTRGFDEVTSRRLVRTNWFRTALWTGRAVALAVLFPSLLGSPT